MDEGGDRGTEKVRICPSHTAVKLHALTAAQPGWLQSPALDPLQDTTSLANSAVDRGWFLEGLIIGDSWISALLEVSSES